MWASSNCSLVRASTRSRRRRSPPRPPAGRAGRACRALDQRAAVHARRCARRSAAASPIVAHRVARRTPPRCERERRVVLALEPDRRGGLVVDPGAPAHRAAEVPGPELDLVGERQQPLVQRAEDRRARPRACSIARSGRATSPTNSESPVSTAHGPSPRLASRSTNEVCSGRWPGCGRPRSRPRRARASSRRRTPRARTRPRRARGCGSSRRSPGPAGRGRRRGRRGCGSRARARSARRAGAPRRR